MASWPFLGLFSLKNLFVSVGWSERRGCTLVPVLASPPGSLPRDSSMLVSVVCTLPLAEPSCFEEMGLVAVG